MTLFQTAPNHMYELRNQTLPKFAEDDFTGTTYRFNNLGYRSNREFEISNDVIVILGNTLSFGLGLNIEKTFSGLIEEQLKYPIYNFSWGRYGHENSEQLILLKNILSLINPRLVIFQINDLNRIRRNDKIKFDNPKELVLEKFNKFYTELNNCLNTIPHILLQWDENNYNIDTSKFLIYNKYHIDSVDFYHSGIYRPTMGKSSHKLIATKILKEIYDKRI